MDSQLLKDIYARKTLINYDGLDLLIPPASEPITLGEAKSYCRVSTSDDDTLLTLLISAARQQVEHRIRKGLISQTWKVSSKEDVCDESRIRLPLGPVISISSVNYRDVSGDWQVLSSSLYSFNASEDPPAILIREIPDVYDEYDEIKWTVEYEIGFSSVPADLKLAILGLTRHYYDHRGQTIVGAYINSVPDTISNILDSNKYWKLL